MASKFHVALDMDDVVVDFTGGLIKSVNIEHGTNLTMDDVIEWDLHPLLDPILGRSFWAWLREREWLWAQFDAVLGAIGAIDRLRRDGHYIEFITSKPDWAEHNVFKWIGLWRPAVQRVTIVKINELKADYTDADLLVDDKLAHCQGFVDQGRTAIMFDAPHSRRTKVPNTIHRAADWREVLGIIEGMAAR